LLTNREELAARCRIKVSLRPGRSASEAQLHNGVPLFLNQLIRTLELEQTSMPSQSFAISGPPGGAPALSEMSVSATQHGKDLYALGFSVDQVVHDYGDLCQAITDLAIERSAPFSINEFRTLNRCLDNAIADAVSEFIYQRDFEMAFKINGDMNERLGSYAQDLRSLLGTTLMAFSAIKTGNLSLSGATGTILERNLRSLGRLIEDSLTSASSLAQERNFLTAFPLSAFIDDAYAKATTHAAEHGCTVRAAAVDGLLALCGDRDRLKVALTNLLEHAIKCTRPGTEVLITAYGLGERILIDVRDRCGGLAPGVAAAMFLPVDQTGAERQGMGLKLATAQQNISAYDGDLSVHDLPLDGCIITMSLPRYEMPT
jgi:signal transduction histidine kinase